MPSVRILGNLNWGRGTPGWPSDLEIPRLEHRVPPERFLEELSAG